MDSMIAIGLLPFWTMGAPLVWILVDHLQNRKTTRTHRDHAMPMRAATA